MSLKLKESHQQRQREMERGSEREKERVLGLDYEVCLQRQRNAFAFEDNFHPCLVTWTSNPLSWNPDLIAPF